MSLPPLILRLLLGSILLSLVGCGISPRPYMLRVLVFSSGDFGQRGDSRAIVVHHSQSDRELGKLYPSDRYRYMRVNQALYTINRALREWPASGESSAAKNRMRGTRDAILEFQRDLRNQSSAVSTFSSRGFARRGMVAF